MTTYADDWETALRALADADDNDPAADKCRPPETVTGGEWPTALALDAWLARFSLPPDISDVVRRTSFRYRGHVGALPVVRGPGRRRAACRVQERRSA